MCISIVAPQALSRLCCRTAEAVTLKKQRIKRVRAHCGRRRKRNSGRWVIEGFFFDTVVIGAGLAAEASNVIEWHIAVPASPFGLQGNSVRRLHRAGGPAWISTVINLVCIIHDSAANKRYQTNTPRGEQSVQYRPIRVQLEKYGKKFDCHSGAPPELLGASHSGRTRYKVKRTHPAERTSQAACATKGR